MRQLCESSVRLTGGSEDGLVSNIALDHAATPGLCFLVKCNEFSRNISGIKVRLKTEKYQKLYDSRTLRDSIGFEVP